MIKDVKEVSDLLNSYIYESANAQNIKLSDTELDEIEIKIGRNIFLYFNKNRTRRFYVRFALDREIPCFYTKIAGLNDEILSAHLVVNEIEESKHNIYRLFVKWIFENCDEEEFYRFAATFIDE